MKDTTINISVLVIAILLVHLIYVGYIWPVSDLAIQTAAESGLAVPRTFAVILKDLEQEVCIILFLWTLFLIFSKMSSIMKSRYLYDVDFLGDLSANLSQVNKILEKLLSLGFKEQKKPLIEIVLTSLRRFKTTNNIQNTSESIDSSLEALASKQDAENSMIRYLIWAIPSIGFIGTVRGIGEALAKADQAVQGDITGMTNSLGVAFNSTFVALIINIILMFFLHQLQRLQDGEVVEIREYCEAKLLSRISKT